MRTKDGWLSTTTWQFLKNRFWKFLKLVRMPKPATRC